MQRYRVAISIAAALLACGCGRLGAGGSEGDGVVGLTASTDLRPTLVAPDDFRWRDVANVAYHAEFARPGFYGEEGRSARLEWTLRSHTLHGHLSLRRLKPNFAYQVKLVGSVPVKASDTARHELGSEEWGSAALGGLGRWCQGDKRANVAREHVARALQQGKGIVGYLLFDFLVTDAEGNAERPLALDSSYHVLWRTDQRDRSRRDSPIYAHRIVRTTYGYGPALTEPTGEVHIFAEREVPHPGHGQLRLPAGKYRVMLNLTEESFHARQKGPANGGGDWAQVMEAPIEFTITD